MCACCRNILPYQEPKYERWIDGVNNMRVNYADTVCEWYK